MPATVQALLLAGLLTTPAILWALGADRLPRVRLPFLRLRRRPSAGGAFVSPLIFSALVLVIALHLVSASRGLALAPDAMRLLQLLLVGGMASVLATPFYPLAGVLGYVVLSYLFPREHEVTSGLMQIGTMSWLAALSAVGSAFFIGRRGGLGAAGLPDSTVLRALAWFAAWLGVAIVAAFVAGRPVGPDLVARTTRYVEALTLCGVAAISHPRLRDVRFLALVCGLVAGVRGAWLTTHWLTEQNLAMVTALTVPVAAALAFARPLGPTQLLLGPLAAYLAVSVVRIQNRGALLGLCAGLIALVVTARKRWWWLAAMAVLAVPAVLWAAREGLLVRFGQIYVQGQFVGSAGERLEIWVGGLGLVSDHWLFGVGPGNFAVLRAQFAHNSLIELLVEAGIVGVALYLFVFLATVRQLVAIVREADTGGRRATARGVIGLCAAHLVAGLFLSNAALVLTYVWLGVAAALASTASSSHTQQAHGGRHGA